MYILINKGSAAVIWSVFRSQVGCKGNVSRTISSLTNSTAPSRYFRSDSQFVFQNVLD